MTRCWAMSSKATATRNLCVFGEKITPNQHKIAHDFVLLDNTYCCGILSADGHQWADSAIATDYMEKSFAGFPRSYPDGMDDGGVDALAYSPPGFIWDNAWRMARLCAIMVNSPSRGSPGRTNRAGQSAFPGSLS